MATNGEDPAAQHLQLKAAVGPNIGYLCTTMEIGVLKALIDWKAFDHIPEDSSPISHSALASAIGGDRELLDRLLPLLVATGVLASPSRDHVAHTPRSRLYRSTELGAGFLVHMHNLFLRAMAHFPAFLAEHGFRSPQRGDVVPLGLAVGRPGAGVYDIIAGDERVGREFDEFVGRASEVFPMRGVYDLAWVREGYADLIEGEAAGGRKVFVDVGGSNGHALRDILMDHPWLPAERCAVFDRAPTIESTRKGLDEGIRGIGLVAGSVIEALPSEVAGALVYQLRRILNDFPDGDVRRCWQSLRKGAARDTRVCVVEELLQEGRNAYGIAQDLSLMLVGGKRRTAEMHAELAGEAGFRLSRTFPDTYNDCSVLEFVLA